MCIDIVEICYGIASEQISSIFDELSARNTSVFYFQDNNLSKSQWIFTICAFLLWRSALGLHIGKFRQFLTGLSAHNMIIAGLNLVLTRSAQCNPFIQQPPQGIGGNQGNCLVIVLT